MIPGRRENMYKLIWIEKVRGRMVMRFRSFPDREKRFRYILKLETRPEFRRVLKLIDDEEEA